jgi:predicted DNA-binding WGR domain protein
MTSIRLERREPARNRQRFYAIIVTRTLLGAWAMVREWGRIGRRGTVRESWFETEAAAIEAATKTLWRSWTGVFPPASTPCSSVRWAGFPRSRS